MEWKTKIARLGAFVASVGFLSMAVNCAAQNSFKRGVVLVKFKQNVGAAAADRAMATVRGRQVDSIEGLGIRVLKLPNGANERSAAATLKRLADVEYAEVDALAPPQSVPNDPRYATYQWNLSKLECASAWDYTIGNASIAIAILDTGVDGSHPDLQAKMVPGYNAYDQNEDSSDVYGHGTLVAGTAAASTNNGMGVAGVAWNCKIMPIRVSDLNGYGSASAMARGLIWAANRGVKVANISYVVHSSLAVTDAARYFRDAGGVVVSSSGNAGYADPSPDNPYIITVGMVGSTDILNPTSNTGPSVDVVAPESTYSTARGGTYASTGGTSIASPMVAGIAALLLSLKPDASPAEIETYIENSAMDLGAVGYDTSHGYGRVNAFRALTLANGGSTPPPPADTTPPSLSMASPTGGSVLMNLITMSASGTDNVAVQKVTLLVDNVEKSSYLGSSCSWTWDTNLMSDGTHTVSAIAKDVAGNTTRKDVTVTIINNDAIAPTVTITSPAAGATIGRSLSVSVNAQDNVGVSKVELYADSKLVSTSTVAPFKTTWNCSKAARGTHVLQVKAYDAKGNVGVSQSVSVVK